MIKRLNMINVFKIKRNNKLYIVSLESLKNTPSGTPRYKAIIGVDNDYDLDLNSSGISLFNAVYTFTGHYLNEKDEANWILDEYLKEVNNA